MPDSTITLKTKSDLSGVKQTTDAFIGLTAAEQKAEQQTLKMAQAYARLDAAQKNPAAGADRLRDALSNATVVTQQHGVAIQTQIASLDNQAAKLKDSASLTSQFGSAIKSSLLGVVGPAALLTAGVGLLKGALDLTEESFKFKAALDTTNLSIALQIKNFRDVNQTLEQGRVFAARYNITQKDNAEAIQASIPLLRQSKASLTDVEGVLTRLSVLKPEQGIQGAAFALGELQGGQSKSLNTRFNIPLEKANELKKEIIAGGDAVKVVGDYLDSVGVGMDALDTRTTGATGKMNQLNVETEKLQLALAGQSGGIGEFLLDVKIKETQKNTRILSGDLSDLKTPITNAASGYNPLVQALINYGVGVFRARDANVQAAAATTDATQRVGAYDAAVQAATASTRSSADALSLDAKTKLDSSIATAQLADEQKQLDKDSALAAQGLLGAGDQALLLAQKYGIAADQAQFLITQQQQLSNSTALADQRVGERNPNNTNTAAQQDKFGKLARQGQLDAAAEKKKTDDKAAQDAARLNDLQNQNRLINASNSAAKIKELERQKAATNDVIKRQEIQNQIDQERQSKGRAGAAGGKGLGALDRVDISLAGDYQAQLDAVNAKLAAGHLTELQTKELKKQQLDLQEKITAETERSANAALDARIAAVEDRKARREEAGQLAGAQRRLASGEFTPEEKAAAQDVIDLIPLQQEKRARDIAAKAREGGIDLPGSAAPPNPFTPGASATPAGSAGAVPSPNPAAAQAPIIIEVDGREIGRIAARFLQSGRNAAALRG